MTHWFCDDFGGCTCEKCALKTCPMVLQMWFDFGDDKDGFNDEGGGNGDDSGNNNGNGGGDGGDDSDDGGGEMGDDSDGENDGSDWDNGDDSDGDMGLGMMTIMVEAMGLTEMEPMELLGLWGDDNDGNHGDGSDSGNDTGDGDRGYSSDGDGDDGVMITMVVMGIMVMMEKQLVIPKP